MLDGHSLKAPLLDQKYIDKELSKLQKYNISQIFHIRTNDTIFFTDIDTNTNIEKSQYFNTKYLTELKILEKNIETTDLIITNNTEFKKGLQLYYPQYTTSNLEICHLGLPNLKRKAIKDTLAEFFIITNMQKIKTYSQYDWISGYVERIKEIYNIPLVNIL